MVSNRLRSLGAMSGKHNRCGSTWNPNKFMVSVVFRLVWWWALQHCKSTPFVYFPGRFFCMALRSLMRVAAYAVQLIVVSNPSRSTRTTPSVPKTQSPSTCPCVSTALVVCLFPVHKNGAMSHRQSQAKLCWILVVALEEITAHVHTLLPLHCSKRFGHPPGRLVPLLKVLSQCDVRCFWQVLWSPSFPRMWRGGSPEWPGPLGRCSLAYS